MTETLFLIAGIFIGYAAHWLASREERETLKLLVKEQHESTMFRLGYRPQKDKTVKTQPTEDKQEQQSSTESKAEQTRSHFKKYGLPTTPPDIFSMRSQAMAEERDRELKRQRIIGMID